MSKAEFQFKQIVDRLIESGIYPGPTAINRARLGTHWGWRQNNINGRECRWREQELRVYGFTYLSPLVSGRKQSWYRAA